MITDASLELAKRSAPEKRAPKTVAHRFDPTLTADDRRKLRNKRKAQARARRKQRA